MSAQSEQEDLEQVANLVQFCQTCSGSEVCEKLCLIPRGEFTDKDGPSYKKEEDVHEKYQLSRIMRRGTVNEWMEITGDLDNLTFTAAPEGETETIPIVHSLPLLRKPPKEIDAVVEEIGDFQGDPHKETERPIFEPGRTSPEPPPPVADQTSPDVAKRFTDDRTIISL